MKTKVYYNYLSDGFPLTELIQNFKSTKLYGVTWFKSKKAAYKDFITQQKYDFIGKNEKFKLVKMEIKVYD